MCVHTFVCLSVCVCVCDLWCFVVVVVVVVCVTDVRLWCGMCMTIYVCARSCDTVCARVYVLMYIYICVRELIFICLRVHMCVCVCVSSVSSLDQLLHFWPPPHFLVIMFL